MPVPVKRYVRRAPATHAAQRAPTVLTYEVRRYPYLGKYEGGLIFDPFVRDLDLEGFGDAEAGDVQAHGFAYSKMNLRGNLKHVYALASAGETTLNEKEKRFLFEHPYVIITEDQYGFVDIDYYPSKSKWEQAWTQIEESVEYFDSDVSSDEPDW